MRLSIITVVLNAAKTIDATIVSVLSQTHPSVEYIVVDGGSTDGTQSCIERYATQIAGFVSEPDYGVYDAINKGIKLATGDMIGVLHADDVYASNTVLERIAAAASENSTDAVYGDLEYFFPHSPSAVARRYSSKRFSPERLAWGWMPAHPTLFLRRELFARYGHYRTDFRIAGDFELIARFFKDGQLTFCYLPEVLVRMRIGGLSTRGWRSTLLLNQEVLRACRENGISTNVLKLLSKYPFKALEILEK